MKIFKIEKNKYLVNELISWLCNIVFVGTISVIILYTTNLELDNIYISTFCILLFQLFDTLQREKITAIKVDAVNNTLAFILSSKLSGKKEKTVPLNLAKAILIKKPTFSIWMYQKLTLEIMLQEKNVFSINKRYGFSENTLIEIEEAINQGLKPNVNTSQLHTLTTQITFK